MKIPFTLLLLSVVFFESCSKKNDVTTSTVTTTTSSPTVTTFAGSGTPGFIDGTKAQASFNYPTGIAISNQGYLFVADKQNSAVRIITPAGVVNTLGGTGIPGFVNTADSVTFNFPGGVGTDAAGNVYVADESNNAIRLITTAGVVSTFAGNGVSGFANATGTAATFNNPASTAADTAGNVYVADNGNNVIRKITPLGVVTTFAGSGVRGAANGTGTAASFNQPEALAIDAAGNVYVADMGNNLIRKITAKGVVTTLAGSGSPGAANGLGTAASFSAPAGVAVDATGNVYVGDSNNNLVRKIGTDGTVTTLAGTGAAGSANGTPAASTFNSPQGVAVDTYNRVFVVDTGNSMIRMIQQ